MGVNLLPTISISNDWYYNEDEATNVTASGYNFKGTFSQIWPGLYYTLPNPSQYIGKTLVIGCSSFSGSFVIFLQDQNWEWIGGYGLDPSPIPQSMKIIIPDGVTTITFAIEAITDDIGLTLDVKDVYVKILGEEEPENPPSTSRTNLLPTISASNDWYCGEATDVTASGYNFNGTFSQIWTGLYYTLPNPSQYIGKTLVIGCSSFSGSFVMFLQDQNWDWIGGYGIDPSPNPQSMEITIPDGVTTITFAIEAITDNIGLTLDVKDVYVKILGEEEPDKIIGYIGTNKIIAIYLGNIKINNIK